MATTAVIAATVKAKPVLSMSGAGYSLQAKAPDPPSGSGLCGSFGALSAIAQHQMHARGANALDQCI